MQHKTPWIRVWTEQLTATEKKQLLDTFLQQEARWKVLLEKEFEEDVLHQRQYLTPARSASVLTQLHTQIRQTTNMPEQIAGARIIRFAQARKWIAAAAVIAVVGLSMYWFRPPATNNSAAPSVIATADGHLRTVINNAKGDSLIHLADGSLVTLAANSSIRYYEPYKDNRRDISLAGQAVFKVAKDTARPFTVYAGGIATTALGTQFLVTTLEQHKVAVRLYEGKVAIHQAAGGPSMKEVILKPGEEFSLDQLQHQFAVTSFKSIPTTLSEPEPTAKKPIRERISMRALEFAQEPLPLVLAAIGKRYHVQFIYDEDALRTEQVTGKFLASDSLSTVLSMLGTVNKLTFTQQHGTIVVSKSEQ